MSYLWIARGGGPGGVIKSSVTGTVTCPSLITFLPLIRCLGAEVPWGGGLKVTAANTGGSLLSDRTAISCGGQMEEDKEASLL